MRGLPHLFKKSIGTVLFILVVLSFGFSSCSKDGTDILGELTTAVTTDPSTVNAGDPVNVIVTVSNISSVRVGVGFDQQEQAGYRLINPLGVVVREFPEMVNLGFNARAYEPNTTEVYELPLDTTALPVGEYTVEAGLLADEADYPWAMVQLTIVGATP